jgi:predicted regulator of Ras-like GTPase activity (Roadblock/LC7/MglB family)
MEDVLAEIIKVDQVNGVILLGPKCKIIARTTRDGWKKGRLEDILYELELTFASLRLFGEEIEEIDFVFEDTRIFARNLAGSALVVFSEPDVDIAMLRMTLNVALAQIKEQAGMYKFISRKWVGPDLSEPDISQIYQALKESDPGEVNHA